MLAHELGSPKGVRRPRKRVGRGNASGRGTYSSRGLKGQKARSGRKPKLGFEGGQTKLIKRLPHRRGFVNHFRIEYSPVNLIELERFQEGTEVTPQLLLDPGVVRSKRRPMKILGNGNISKPLNVRAHKFSQNARQKIEAAGGKVVEVGHDGDSS